MATITLTLSEERLAKLRQLAKEQGVPPEEFLSTQIDRLLEQPESEFRKAAQYVLQKNAELYRRLA